MNRLTYAKLCHQLDGHGFECVEQTGRMYALVDRKRGEYAMFEVNVVRQGIILRSIYVSKPQIGLGKKTLAKLTAIADIFDTPVYLAAKPFIYDDDDRMIENVSDEQVGNEGRMTASQLANWYEQNGFTERESITPDGVVLMKRPAKSERAVTA